MGEKNTLLAFPLPELFSLDAGVIVVDKVGVGENDMYWFVVVGVRVVVCGAAGHSSEVDSCEKSQPPGTQRAPTAGPLI